MIYLDHATTALPKAQSVGPALKAFMEEGDVSPGRNSHSLGRAANARIAQVRVDLAALIHADAAHLAFVSNATFGLNLLIKGCVRPGDHVITTCLEHNSVLRPLSALAQAGIIELEVLDCDLDGVVAARRFVEALRPNSSLLAVAHASNVLGVCAPLSELGRIAATHGVRLLIDAAQTVGIVPLDVRIPGVSYVAFSGHKGLRGPSGTGAIWLRDPSSVLPLVEGGTGTNSQSLIHPRRMPERFEAGTLNYLGLVGLGAAVRETLGGGCGLYGRAQKIAQWCATALQEIHGVRVLGWRTERVRVPVVSFAVDRVPSGEVAHVLDDSYGVVCRPGLHCAPLAHKRMGTARHGAVRFSFGPESECSDAHAAVEAVRAIVHATRRRQPLK